MHSAKTGTGRRKTDDVGRALLEMGQARGPDVKMPTMRELCAKLGVSRTTLERALVPLERRGLFRRRHGSGIYVTSAIRQKTIGIVFGGDIFSDHFSPFWGLMLKAVCARAGDRNLQLRTYLDISEPHNGIGGHEQLSEDAATGRLQGLVLIAPTENLWRQMQASALPMVTFGGPAPNVAFDAARLNDMAANEIAGMGVSRLGLLVPDEFAAHGPAIEQSLRTGGRRDVEIADWSYGTWASKIAGAGSRENCAYLLARRLIQDAPESPLPQAVVSLEDTMTRGVITAMQQAGLQPGRDIRFVTIANKGSSVLEPYASCLTQMEIDPADCMRAALDLLGTLMDGDTPPVSQILIAPRMVGRCAEVAPASRP